MMTRPGDAIMEIVADVCRDRRHACDSVCALISVAALMASYLPQPAQREISRHMVEELVNLHGGVETILGARFSAAELIEH